ncbi:MAG: xanthine dehydrogenase family protein subunit M [Desulfuromonadales bacterium]|nr:xanthine dehydrogenase family protein subunit M [Desulfuromonadales bacterium]
MSTRVLPDFEILVPQSKAEALKQLSQHKDDAAILAGGTDLLVQMKGQLKCNCKGENAFSYLLSLAEVPGLDYVEYDETDGLKIGAMATLSQVAAHPAVKENYPGLLESIEVCGTKQTRNMGTVVGNLLNASPCADCGCSILAWGGTLTLEGPEGSREVDFDDFYLGYRLTARNSDEIALEIKLPPKSEGTVSAHHKMTRVEHDLSKITVSVRLEMSGKTCQSARIAMASVAPTIIRLKETEKLLTGVEITDQVLESVAKSASAEVTPIDDVRSTAEYRRDVSGVMVKRLIKKVCNV